MNYLKTWCFVGLLAFCVSCGGGTDTSNTDNTDTASANTSKDTAATSGTPDKTTNDSEKATNDVNKSTEQALQLPEDFKSAMPGWELVPQDKWLSGDFQKAIDPENKLVYANEIMIRGQFNNDDYEDIACFVINQDKKTRLVIIPGKESGFGKPIPITDLDGDVKNEGAVLGMGLSKKPAGKVKTLAGEITIDVDGIGYSRYGKAGGMYYSKGGKFVMVETAD